MFAGKRTKETTSKVLEALFEGAFLYSYATKAVKMGELKNE